MDNENKVKATMYFIEDGPWGNHIDWRAIYGTPADYIGVDLAVDEESEDAP